MISWSDVNSYQKKKLDLQVELNDLMHSSPSIKTDDKINELRSEILYLDKQIEKILGSKEIERQRELKNKKFGVERINKSNYYSFKSKFKKISPMKIATTRMIGILEAIQREQQLEESRVKVKV